MPPHCGEVDQFSVDGWAEQWEETNGMAVRIIKHAMEIIHLLTDLNPIQVIVDAVINSGPREDATRIGSAGVVGARESAFRNIKTIAEWLADEVINAAKGSSNSCAIKKKDEIERVAKANR
ncbi:hypothetical protein NE237_027898 [Protea cynaroides]|uniref:Small ribosomal subunit protein uS7 domain-containing protein n=1 Tax=Protea cynaroides TaxID=273540 RepID=A0A9Q0GND2_9MAGN|nr:hypothetical protein NE237_027898 [Protea cynaroides]